MAKQLAADDKAQAWLRSLAIGSEKKFAATLLGPSLGHELRRSKGGNDGAGDFAQAEKGGDERERSVDREVPGHARQA